MSRVSCPSCGAKADGSRGCLVNCLILCTFPIGLIFLAIPCRFKCRKCKHTFKQ